MQFARQIAIAALIPAMAWGVEPATDGASEQENPDFARYRTIIDRMPFGEPPPGFDPTQAPGSAAAAATAADAAQGGMTEEQRTEEEQRLASSVRVSVLNVTPSGRTMVGFTDSSAKPPEHYYLPVGGERDGWAVKAADPATEKVTLAKGEVEVTLKLGEGSTGDGKGDKRRATGQGAPQPIRRGGMMGARLAGGGPVTPMGASGANGESSTAGGALARLREGRMRRMQEERAEAARRAAAANEERAENERREAEAKAAAAEAAAEREQLRADREQQRAALLQIQEELRRQREEKEKRQVQESQEEQPE